MSSPFGLAEAITSTILSILLLVIGTILLFWGAKLIKSILFLNGFIVGMLFTYFFLQNVGIPEHSTFLSYSIIIAIFIGVCFGLILVYWFDVAVFVGGAICGIIIAQLVWHLITSWVDVKDEQVYNVILVIIFAIAFGFLATKFVIYLAKPITAFIGSFLTSSGLAYFIQRYGVKEYTDNIMDITQYFNANNTCGANCWIFIAIWAVLFAIGMVVQYDLCNRKVQNDSQQPREDSPLLQPV
eukprot:309972_1